MSGTNKTLRLTLDTDHHSQFIALVTTKPSYELAWNLNDFLDLSLTAQEDYEIPGLGYACSFHCFLDSYESDVFLFRQTTTKGRLFPEVKNVDYLMVEQNFENNFALEQEMLRGNGFLDFFFKADSEQLRPETLKNLKLI
jgi:hypothetical protein